MFTLKSLGKKEKIRPHVRRWKKTTKIREEINEIENIQISKKINKTKASLIEKTN